MTLDIITLLTGNTTRLRNVVRYSTCRRVNDEDVAQHSFYTVLYSALIATWVERNSKMVISWALLMTKASLHDVEEAISGDFPRPFKVSDPALKSMLDVAALKACRVACQGIFPDDEEMLPGLWERAKNRTTEGRIVSLADCLSVLSYLYQEREAGNYGIHEHAADVEKYWNEFLDPSYDFLRPLIRQADPLVRLVTSARPAVLGGPDLGNTDQLQREPEGSDLLHVDEVKRPYVQDVHPGGEGAGSARSGVR